MRTFLSTPVRGFRRMLCMFLVAQGLAIADKPAPPPGIGPRQREIWVPEKSLPEILAANPKAVVMTREEYKALVRDSGTPVLPTVHVPPVAATIVSAQYKGALTGNAIVAEAEFVIDCLAKSSEGWQSIELPLDLASLAAVTLDTETAVNVISPAQAEGQPAVPSRCMVLIRTPGRHVLKASFFIPIHESTTGSHLSIPSPNAPSANFALELPSRYTLYSGAPVASKVLPNGNLLHTIPLPTALGKVDVTWRARDIAPLAGGAVLQACSYLYEIDPVRVTADLGIVLRSALARVPKAITIPLPESAKVLSVDGPDVLQWTMEKNTIFLSFTSAELRETTLRILLETPPVAAEAPSKDLVATLPQPSVAGVHRASGSFAIIAARDVRVRNISTAGLTAQTTLGLPGNAANKPGFVAGFSFPALTAPPVVTYQQLEPRFQADQLVKILLKRDTIELSRALRILVKEGEIFTTTLHLPAGEEMTKLTLSDGSEPVWKFKDPTTIEVKWPVAVTTTNPGNITMLTRMDPQGWFTLGEKPRVVRFAGAVIDGPELVTGYVGLDFDNRFHVSTTATTGLEPTDPARLASHGVPLNGRLTWALAETFTLDLAVSRRPSEVHAHLTAYALPLLHSCEVEGQIELDVRNSGVRQLLVAAPPELAEHLRFDSPLIAERRLQPLTGEWTLTFHEELTGTPRLRFHWSLPFSTSPNALVPKAPVTSATGQRFALALPLLKLPEAGRVTGTWVIEANTDTELAINAQGLDDRDTLALPKVENYTPQHRVIAAYAWRGSAWQLSLEGTRHPAAPLPGLVVDRLEIQTTISTDGAQRHQMLFSLRSNGEQFFQCPLPTDAKILSLTIDGKSVKPVADPVLRAQQKNGLRVQLPATIEARPASIQLTYEIPGEPLKANGKLQLDPPAIHAAIPVLASAWTLHLPNGYSYSNFSGDLHKEFELATQTLTAATNVNLPTSGLGEKVSAFFSKDTVFRGRVVFQVNNPASADPEQAVAAERQLIEANETLSEVVRLNQLTKRSHFPSDEALAVAQLEKMTEVSGEPGTDLVHVDVFSPDPTEAAGLANSIASVYEARRKEIDHAKAKADDEQRAQQLEKTLAMRDAKRQQMLELMKRQTILDFSDASKFAKSEQAIKDQEDYIKAKQEYEYASQVIEAELKKKVDLTMPMLSIQRNENAVPSMTPYTGKTVRIQPSMPQPLFAGTPLPGYDIATREPQKPFVAKPVVKEMDGEKGEAATKSELTKQAESKTSGAVSGLIPLEVALPESGRSYRFRGNHLPGPIVFEYKSWERSMHIAWIFILLGAGGAWLLARQRPIFIGLIVGLSLHFAPAILGASLQKACNGLLLGWVIACVGFWLVGKLKHRVLRRAALTAMAAVMFGQGIVSPSTAAEVSTTPSPYTAYVPFDSTKPLADQTPGRYFLTYETFQALWAQARTNKLQAAKPDVTPDGNQAAWASIQTALYKASIDGKRLLVDATLTIHSAGTWASADLSFSGASIGGLTLDGAAAPLKDGRLLIEKSGAHVVTAKLEIPLQSNWLQTSFKLPRAAASLLSLQLTDMSSRLKLNNGLPTVETAIAEGGPARVITAALGNAQELKIERSLAATMANQGDKLPPSAKVTSALYLSPALQRLESTVQYLFPGADRQDFSLELDSTITPISLDIPNLETWTLSTVNEKKLLAFRLALPVRDTLQLKLTGERVAPPSPSQETFPHVVPNVVRLDRQLLLLAVDELDVKPKAASIHQQIDFPDLAGADVGFQRIACYMASGPLVPLEFGVARRTLAAELQADYLYQLSPSKLEIHGVFHLKPARGQDLLQATAKLPAGFTVTRVDSERLQDWWVDADRLNVRFSGPTPDTTTLLLGLAQSWKELPAKLPFAPIQLENVGVARGRGQIAALPDVNVQLSFAQPVTIIREIGANEKRQDYPAIGEFKLTAPFEAKREFTFDALEFAAEMTLGKVASKYDARWVMAAEVQESWVRVEARCDVEVKAGALSEFVLSLPASAVANGDPRILGEHVREVIKLPAKDAAPTAPVSYKIALQRPITTATQFTISLEVPHAGEIHLPDLVFQDSGINERFLVVQNASPGELHYEAARSRHVEPMQAREIERDLHFKIENFAQPLYFRAGADWDLTMKLEKLATTTGTKALVLFAELTTALRANGEEWLKADYRLQNRTLQFLPVRLPEGFQLMSAIVSGQPVRADMGERDTRPVLLIPLIQTRPGDLALDVQLVCRKLPNASFKLGDKLSLSLDDPELPGVTVERTVWRVAVPEGYGIVNDRGNMEKVVAPAAEQEKIAATLNEINQLVSIGRSTDNSAEVRQRSKLNAWMMCNEVAQSSPQNASGQELQVLMQQINTLQIDQTIAQPDAGKDRSSNWSWTGNSTYLKSRERQLDETQQKEAQLARDNLGLNDNVISGNKTLYFKYNAPQEQVVDAPAKPVVNSRSQAVNKLQQADFDDDKTISAQFDRLESQRASIQISQALGAAQPGSNGVITVSGGAIVNGVTGDATLTGTTKNDVDFVQNYRSAGNRVDVGQTAMLESKPAATAVTEDATKDMKGQPELPAPAVDAAPKLRPAGRVSLPVNFPITTEPTYFKKVKDHANAQLVVEKLSEPGNKRFSSIAILAVSLLVLVLINAIQQKRARRKRLVHS